MVMKYKIILNYTYKLLKSSINVKMYNIVIVVYRTLNEDACG